MTMEIYWGSGSPYAWRALLALEVKKASYTSKIIEFSKNQHRSPEFLALNPRGRVPTLKDGKIVLPESLAIIAYLDRKIPDPPLFGRSDEETARIWKSLSDCMYYLERPANRIIGPAFFNKVAENEADMRVAAAEVHAELKGLEKFAANGGWLAGDRISAADVAAYPFVEVLLRAAGKDAVKPLDLGFLPFAKTYPGIEAWRQRIQALPGYEKTYPPHWR